MPPKRVAKTKLYELAVEVPPKTVVNDVSSKREFVVGRQFATGGFGRIYTCCESGKSADLVIKVEPSGNGPLFTEVNVFMKILKYSQVEEFKKSHKLKWIGIPYLISAGIFSCKEEKLRYLIMPKYATSLESIREKQKTFDANTVFTIAKCTVQSLEYIHSKCYTHADVKAANILLEKATDFSSCVLVDYGLARMSANNEEKADKKRAHNGTAIFTSLDAHRGFHPSYRADLEILAYNMIYWLTGDLPWMKFESDVSKVHIEKEAFVKSLDSNLKKLLSDHFSCIPFITQLFEMAFDTPYTQGLDFKKLFTLLDSALAVGKVQTGKPKKRLSESPLVESSRVKKGKKKQEQEQDQNNSIDSSPPISKSKRRPTIKSELNQEEKEEQMIRSKTPRKPSRNYGIKEELIDDHEILPRSTRKTYPVRSAKEEPFNYDEEVATKAAHRMKKDMTKVRAVKKEVAEIEEKNELERKPTRTLPRQSRNVLDSSSSTASSEEVLQSPKLFHRLPLPRGFASAKRLNMKRDIPVPGLRNKILPRRSVDKGASPKTMNRRSIRKSSSLEYTSPAASPDNIKILKNPGTSNKLTRLKKTPEKIPNSVKQSPTKLRNVVPGIRNFSPGRRTIFINQITNKYKKIARKSMGKSLNIQSP